MGGGESSAAVLTGVAFFTGEAWRSFGRLSLVTDGFVEETVDEGSSMVAFERFVELVTSFEEGRFVPTCCQAKKS